MSRRVDLASLRCRKSRVSSYSEAFRLYAQASEDELVARIHRAGIKRRFAREEDMVKRLRDYEHSDNTRQQDDGMKRFLAIQRIFRTELIWAPSQFQIEAFEKVLRILAVQIFGEDWEKYGQQYCHENNIELMRSIVALVASRRHGKTSTMGMSLVTLLLTIPTAQAIFSTCQRISDALKSMVLNFIRNSRYANRVSPRSGGEIIKVRSGLNDNTTQTATGTFLPAAKKISFSLQLLTLSLNRCDFISFPSSPHDPPSLIPCVINDTFTKKRFLIHRIYENYKYSFCCTNYDFLFVFTIAPRKSCSRSPMHSHRNFNRRFTNMRFASCASDTVIAHQQIPPMTPMIRQRNNKVTTNRTSHLKTSHDSHRIPSTCTLTPTARTL